MVHKVPQRQPEDGHTHAPSVSKQEIRRRDDERIPEKGEGSHRWSDAAARDRDDEEGES